MASGNSQQGSHPTGLSPETPTFPTWQSYSPLQQNLSGLSFRQKVESLKAQIADIIYKIQLLQDTKEKQEPLPFQEE